MNSPASVACLAAGLLACMVGCVELGWRWGRKSRGVDNEARKGLDAIHAAVFGLLSLMLAFTFGTSMAHWETRRQQIVEEGNVIASAYQKLDVLAAADRDALRPMLRDYLRARMKVYERLRDRGATEAAAEKAMALGDAIWTRGVKSCGRSPLQAACMLLMPALNAVSDVAHSRLEALEWRTPDQVVLLLLGLAPISALLAGFVMSEGRRRSWAHAFLYAAVVTLSIMVILGIDNARFGSIRLDKTQARVMGRLLGSMRP